MRKATLVLCCLALGLIASPRLWADEPPTPPVPPPAAAPGDPGGEIAPLVRDLGAPEYAKRENAFKRLLQIGEPARPALEEARQSAETPETRWRAEQILRRLDRERERPMGADAGPPIPRPGERPPAPPRTRLGQLERRFDEIRRRLEKDFGMFGPVERNDALNAPGLRLEIHAFGLIASVVLHVEPGEDESGTPTRARVHRGRELEGILAREPELRKLAGMDELLEKWVAYKRRHPAMFPLEMLARRGGFGPRAAVTLFGSGHGVEISQNGDRVHVKITERNEQGEMVVNEYEGESLEELKREHPELEDKLGISVRIMPTQVFPSRRSPFSPRARPAVPSVATPRASNEADLAATFGVVVRTPGPVLATHLPELEEGQGLLVEEVRRGSPAQAMGVEPYDIVLAVDGHAVELVDAGRRALLEAARRPGPLTLDVLRRGRRIELRR